MELLGVVGRGWGWWLQISRVAVLCCRMPFFFPFPKGASGVTVCFWTPRIQIKMKHYSEVVPNKEAGSSEFKSWSCHLLAGDIEHVTESSGALVSLCVRYE